MRRSMPLAAAIWAICVGGSPAGGGWMDPAWAYRRGVDVPKYKATRLPGADVAVVEMPTGGLCKPDGSDIRVTAAGGALTAHRVLMMGPGDRVRLAFALRPPAVRNYHVYFGNPKADPPEDPLDIRRGVLLATWKYPGGAINTFKHIQAIFDREKAFLGRAMLDRIFMGHNPFGPDARLASTLTGWLIVRKGGVYNFATSSRNASFLLLDDKLVVSNGGWHGPQRRFPNPARVRVEPGLHKLTVHHVTNGGDPIVLAAWRRPEDPHLQLIPPGAYAPFFRGTPGAIQTRGGKPQVDFLPVHAGEAFMGNRYYQRYEFKALATKTPRKAEYVWDFGDGQTAGGEAVQHVYLIPGQYTVKLSTAGPAPKLARTNRIYVSRPWERVTSNRLDSVRHYASLVMAYDFQKLQPADAVAEAVLLLHRGRTIGGVVRAGDALVQRKAVSPRRAEEAITIYADQLLAEGKFDRAIQGLRKAADMANRPQIAAPLLVRAANIALERGEDADLAFMLYQQVGERFGAIASIPAIRGAKIGIGDVWRVRGDYEKAEKAYRAAGAGVQDKHRGKEAFVKGDLARHVEDYIRTRKYDDAKTFLDEWADTFPLDKLEGYWSLLRVRRRRALIEHAHAVREVEVLAKVNPRSNYAAGLLMLGADSYRRLGKPEEGRKLLRQVVGQFPESPFAAEAEKELKGR